MNPTPIVDMYKEIKKATKADDTACAILAAAEMLNWFRLDAKRLLNPDMVEHLIVMGFRQALFGTNANSDSSILSLDAIAEAIAKLKNS